jgi:predicted translin family RNA/ssDNA-binding protein
MTEKEIKLLIKKLEATEKKLAKAKEEIKQLKADYATLLEVATERN